MGCLPSHRCLYASIFQYCTESKAVDYIELSDLSFCQSVQHGDSADDIYVCFSCRACSCDCLARSPCCK
ncbi:hypothetical protein V2G26_003971 [Clonostachys chloroleuca]